MSTIEKHDGFRRSVGAWLSCRFEWRIPVYQRHYAWDADVDSGPVHLFWETVEEQAIARLNNESPNPHYFGAVLVDRKAGKQEQLSGTKSFDVVDGQQRLTTVQIALLAIVQVAENLPCGELIRDELKEYIYSDASQSTPIPKLCPTNFDAKQYKTVLFHAYGEISPGGSKSISNENYGKSRIIKTFDFFKERISEFVSRYGSKFDAGKTLNSLQKSILDGFDIVLISLEKTDEAQKVFESLNNYAKPLTTFDLIRNNVFYRAAQEGPNKDVELFNMLLWQQLERPQWEASAGQRTSKEKNTHIEAYIARMLVAKTKDDTIKFNRNDIFKAYKKFSKKYKNDVVREVESVIEYIDIYKYLAAMEDEYPVAKNFRFGIFRWNMWNNKDFYPLIFVMLKSGIAVREQQKLIDMLESYVVRRGVCKLSYRHYNLDAATLCKKVGEHPSYAKLREILTESDSDTTRFPNDEEVYRKSKSAKFYKSPIQSYVFKEIAKYKEESLGEVDICNDLTIDHILPQGWEQNSGWKKSLLNKGEKSREGLLLEGNNNDPNVIETFINTIGNLTLMAGKRNSNKSNKSWKDARKLLEKSGLQMNRDLANQKRWGVAEITDRSSELADIICNRWPYPR